MIFLRKTLFSVSFSVFQICYMTVFAMRTDFPFLLSWYKRKGNEKKKSRLTSPGLLRKGRSGTEKWTRSVALRSDSIFQSRPSIPPLTPLRLGQSFFYAKALRCWIWVLLFSSVYFYVESVKYLSISHWKFCLLARNSLYLGWVYILNLSLYILKLSFYILSLSIELLWWRE